DCILIESPDDPVGLRCIIRIQYYMNEASASLKTLEKISASDRGRPDLQDLPFYLGTLYWQEKRYDQVAEHYNIYLKTDPSNIEARAQLADALYHLGNIPQEVVRCARIGTLTRTTAKG